MNFIGFRASVLFGLLFVLGNLRVHAQYKNITLRGVVKDSIQNKPIAFASITLYKSSQGAPLHTTLCDTTGSFTFATLDTGTYLMIVTHTGYKQKKTGKLVASINGITVQCDPILLLPDLKSLKEVIVTASASLIEQKDDKLIYNVEADPSAQGQSLIDIFRKTPLLSVDGNDKVLLNGQSDFKVLVNGRETAMFKKNLKDALNGFPADLIKKIEIITSPSSKYDGEGVGGIINIITKKKITGYNSSISLSRNSLTNTSGSAAFNLKYGKLGFSTYYGFNFLEKQAVSIYSSIESFNPVAFYKWLYSGEGNTGFSNNYANAEISWDIDTLNTISLYGDFNTRHSHFFNKRYADIISANKADTSHNQYFDTSRSKNPTLNWGGDFIHKFRNNPEHELTVKVYFEQGIDRSLMNSSQFNTLYSDRFIINNNKSWNFHKTLAFDYVHPFLNKAKIEAGTKIILRNAETNYGSFFKYAPSDEYISDTVNSNELNYAQNVYSAYVLYRKPVKKFNFRIGSRIEFTTVNGDFIKSDTSIRQRYLTIIPNIYVSYAINKMNMLSASYTRRLRRPYIWDLNPFKNNIDTFNVSYGNPKLNAEIYDLFELGYSLIRGRTNINVRLTEMYSKNQIVQYSILNDNTGITSQTLYNFGNYSSTNLNGSIGGNINSHLRINSNVGLYYTFIKNRVDPLKRNEGWAGYANLSITYESGKKYATFINSGFSRPPVTIQGKNAVIYSHSAGFNYRLFKNKVTASLSVNNIFSKERIFKNMMKDSNFISEYRQYSPYRYGSVSIRWNFGKYSNNVSRKRGVVNEDLHSKVN